MSQALLPISAVTSEGFEPEILTEIYIGHPYLITALFEIRQVAYFGPKQNTFDQKTILCLLTVSAQIERHS